MTEINLDRRATWELKQIVRALSLHRWLNTQQENARLERAKKLLKSRENLINSHIHTQKERQKWQNFESIATPADVTAAKKEPANVTRDVSVKRSET